MARHDNKAKPRLQQNTSPSTTEKARGKQEEGRTSYDRPMPVTQATAHGTENADNSEYTDGHNIGP